MMITLMLADVNQSVKRPEQNEHDEYVGELS
jgi:hypothetical protein